MGLEQHNGRASILTKKEVPFYDQVADYAWISSLKQTSKIQEKIDQLTEERTSIEALPISKGEYLSRLKKSHGDLQARLAGRLQRYLADSSLRHSTVVDPLFNFELRFERPHGVEYVPTWFEIEAAITRLPDTGIDDQERVRLLRKIDRQITELTADLRAVSPPVTNVHRTFAEFWQNLQSQLSEPSGPRAMHLDASSEDEKRAWTLLNLAEHVNPKGISPNPGD